MIYKSIAERLRLRLSSTNFDVGSTLPSEKNLSVEFGVSRMTIRKAVDLLIEHGLVARKHGSGTYIIKKDVHEEITSLNGFSEVMRKQGKTVISSIISFFIMPAPPAIAYQLRIKSGENIFFSRRLRFVDSKPLMVEDSYMPTRLFRNLSISHLEDSKFTFLENECQMKISGNSEVITPILADDTLSGLLKISAMTPILQIASLTYNNRGEYIDYSIVYRNASEYKVEYHLNRDVRNIQ
ncbi:GntR family transcriptional regulator [Pantoea vagans]|uniref:GntR family transcriptional regulator n=1 Tax=Pantoea vagans TaxID=470934 RepID=UPI00301913EB